MVRDRTDTEFLTTLKRIQPASIHDLCEATSVTPTAVRQRLNRLQADHLVSRSVVRQEQERGRPRHVYAVTEAGLRLLGDDHVQIASVLWREIMRIPSAKDRDQVLSGVKTALVRRFGDRTTSPSLVGRVQELCETLTEHGFEVDCTESGEEGLPVLREYNCPYYGLVSEDSSFCDVERSVLAELVGAPVALSACRLDGHGCCEFQFGVPR